MPLLTEGQMVRSTYEVERFLGEGAFAEVYRVRHRFLGRQAMKVFKQTGMSVAETEAALGEAILLSRIGHPNVVRVFDADVVETNRGTCGFFTMEFVAGGSLEQFWRSHGTQFVPVATTVEVLIQVCRGLAVAHSESPPIIHRDIKPQNILVGYDGAGLRVRVSDFGLARRVNPLTLLASARGTRAFKAPECFLGPEADSAAGDVWALGCTLYLLLTDCLPFAGDASTSRPPPISSAPHLPPSNINANSNEGLDAIVSCALNPDPGKRYEDARVLLKALEEWKQRPSGSPGPSFPSTDTSKEVFGRHSTPDEAEARRLAAAALMTASEPGRLSEAADQMEDALNRWPPLRDQYGYQISLWRRGVML